jgi:predicted TIM-barrel fold metal-dependent hydrolase
MRRLPTRAGITLSPTIHIVAIVIYLLLPLWVCRGQTPATATPTVAPIPQLTIDQFAPRPQANLKATLLTRAAHPVVDIHTHFWVRMRHDPEQLKGFVEIMDRNNIAICISLDGRLGNQLDDHIRYLWTDYKDRFVIFANLDWQGGGQTDKPDTWACNQPDFARRMALALSEAKQRGISGLKIFKSLGLEYRNADGSLIQIDDPRFDPIWQACGQLGLPVIIHAADPSAFFEPITPRNERYEELSRRPEWHFPADKFPTRADLHQARNNLFARHSETVFIAAHFGNDGEDLIEAGQLLDRFPNVVLDIASRISELGRQPYSAREFLLRYSERVLFGTDGPWPEKRLHSYWRFLETRDEYFPYSEKEVPPQGLWQIYGLYLPEEILKKIYQDNAARIIPGVRERLDRLAKP